MPADVKSERMWSPIDEAVALRDAEAAKILYTYAGGCSHNGWRAHRRAPGCGCCAAACRRAPAVPLDAYLPAAYHQLLAASSHSFAARSRLLADAKKAKRAKKEQLVKIMEQVGVERASVCVWPVNATAGFAEALLRRRLPLQAAWVLHLWRCRNVLPCCPTLLQHLPDFEMQVSAGHLVPC